MVLPVMLTRLARACMRRSSLICFSRVFRFLARPRRAVVARALAAGRARLCWRRCRGASRLRARLLCLHASLPLALLALHAELCARVLLLRLCLLARQLELVVVGQLRNEVAARLERQLAALLVVLAHLRRVKAVAARKLAAQRASIDGAEAVHGEQLLHVACRRLAKRDAHAANGLAHEQIALVDQGRRHRALGAGALREAARAALLALLALCAPLNCLREARRVFGEKQLVVDARQHVADD